MPLDWDMAACGALGFFDILQGSTEIRAQQRSQPAGPTHAGSVWIQERGNAGRRLLGGAMHPSSFRKNGLALNRLSPPREHDGYGGRSRSKVT